MSHDPFILRWAEPVPRHARGRAGDGATDSDELPAILARHTEGYVVASDTRFTEAAQETTDDT